jgi:hypothetical protein
VKNKHFECVYRWHQTTLSDPLEAAKTAWPVSYVEAVFLPEFKIKGDITERDFQVCTSFYQKTFDLMLLCKKL